MKLSTLKTIVAGISLVIATNASVVSAALCGRSLQHNPTEDLQCVSKRQQQGNRIFRKPKRSSGGLLFVPLLLLCGRNGSSLPGKICSRRAGRQTRQNDQFQWLHRGKTRLGQSSGESPCPALVPAKWQGTAREHEPRVVTSDGLVTKASAYEGLFADGGKR